MLERKGHTVVIAGNGREALDLLEKTSFDMVLMDVQMPEVDGYGATAAIREREKLSGRHLPILAVTAHSRPDELQRCLAAGMDGCVTKPIHEADLWDAMHGVMGVACQSEIPPVVRRDPAAFDENVVLSRVNGDLDLLRDIVGLFLEDCPLRITRMREAVSRGDANGLETASHALKGAIANFTTNGAYQAAQQVESLARSRELGACEVAIGILEAELSNLTPELIRLAGMTTWVKSSGCEQEAPV